MAGLGRSGRAAARLLATNGFAVVGFDDDKSVAPCEWCGETWTGEDCLGHIGGLEGLVLSPGIPSASPMPRAAVEAGIPVTGEIELASRYAQAPILAVTGSNGKTTTSEWLGHVLNRAGIRACVAVQIINAVVKLGRKSVVDKRTLAIFVLVFGAGVITSISPVWFVVLAAAAGVLLKQWEARQSC